jgi:hypothetical protein
VGVEREGEKGKSTNENGRAEDGGPAPAQRPVEHNGQGFVGDDIAQEQRDEDPVLPVLEETQHLLGRLAFVRLARGRQHLEVDFILAHQPARGSAMAGI